VRPGWDLVALPVLPEVQELWGNWSQEHSLGSHQAIWYEPRLEGSRAKDPATEVCREVFAVLASAREAPQQRMLLKSLCFFPRLATPTVIAEAACNGLRVLRQSGMPAIRGRTWQHPRISATQSCKAPSFRDLLPPGLSGVRYLRGYEAEDAEGLRQAWKQLQQECPPGSRFVLKPSGCGGSITDVQEGDLEAFRFDAMGPSASVVLEEMVVGVGQPEPHTLDMVRDVPCGSIGKEHLPRCCALAAQCISKLWGLHGLWSLDFATDSEGTRAAPARTWPRSSGRVERRIGWQCPQGSGPFLAGIPPPSPASWNRSAQWACSGMATRASLCISIAQVLPARML